MLVVVGIVLLFIGLIMVLGKANIHTTEIIVHKKEEEKNNKYEKNANLSTKKDT